MFLGALRSRLELWTVGRRLGDRRTTAAAARRRRRAVKTVLGRCRGRIELAGSLVRFWGCSGSGFIGARGLPWPTRTQWRRRIVGDRFPRLNRDLLQIEMGFGLKQVGEIPGISLAARIWPGWLLEGESRADFSPAGGVRLGLEGEDGADKWDPVAARERERARGRGRARSAGPAAWFRPRREGERAGEGKERAEPEENRPEELIDFPAFNLFRKEDKSNKSQINANKF